MKFSTCHNDLYDLKIIKIFKNTQGISMFNVYLD